MKNFIHFIFVFLIGSSSLMAQTLIGERVSDLMPELYAISGDAILQEFDDGTLTLSLSDDFTTPFGPDVRILLSNSLSASAAIEIANITDISHFNGAITFDVPANISLDEYDYVLFFCVQFNQFWASGELGENTIVSGNGCAENGMITSGGLSDVDLCPSNGNTAIVDFSNNLNISAGDNYAYLITDSDEVLQEVVIDDAFDFAGSSDQTQRVYGISYNGQLVPVIGANRLETTATDCFIHSDENTFLSITKNACTATPVIDVELSAQVEIFPNPAFDKINITIPESFVPEQVSVINMLGVEVLSQEISNAEQIELRITNIDTGNYILSIQNKDQILTRMIQIVK